MHPGEHERSIWPGDDREPAAPPVHPGRGGGLPVPGFSGDHLRLVVSEEYSNIEVFPYMNSNVRCLQKERFLKTGWEHADALDMMTVYSMLPQDDVAR